MLGRLTKGASYVLLAIGLVLLVAARFSDAVETSTALATLAASCLLYATAPDAGEVRVEHAAMLGHVGIRYHPLMGRLANAAAGGLLLWLAFG